MAGYRPVAFSSCIVGSQDGGLRCSAAFLPVGPTRSSERDAAYYRRGRKSAKEAARARLITNRFILHPSPSATRR